MSFINVYPLEPAFYPPHWARQLAHRRAAAASAYRQLAQQQASLFSAFTDALSQLSSSDEVAAPGARAPKTELREVENGYVLEAELPGVRKEDLEVTIGEGGKTVRIEGKVVSRSPVASAPEPAAAAEAEKPAEAAVPVAEPTTATTEDKVAEKPAAEVAAPYAASTAAPETQYTSTFSQTFSLPRAVDGSRVVAKLEHGVLLLVVPFLEDRESVRVTVD